MNPLVLGRQLSTVLRGLSAPKWLASLVERLAQTEPELQSARRDGSLLVLTISLVDPATRRRMEVYISGEIDDVLELIPPEVLAVAPQSIRDVVAGHPLFAEGVKR